MTDRWLLRLRHIDDAIGRINKLIAGQTAHDFATDVFKVAALERFLEIISEASRHIPEDIKYAYGPAIPWRRIADLGNNLRHAYAKSDIGILWEITQNELPKLHPVILAMLTNVESD